MTALKNKITSFLPLHTFLYYLLLSLLLCKFFKVPTKEKPLLAFKCVYVCVCVYYYLAKPSGSSKDSRSDDILPRRQKLGKRHIPPTRRDFVGD